MQIHDLLKSANDPLTGAWMGPSFSSFPSSRNPRSNEVGQQPVPKLPNRHGNPLLVSPGRIGNLDPLA